MTNDPQEVLVRKGKHALKVKGFCKQPINQAYPPYGKMTVMVPPTLMTVIWNVRCITQSHDGTIKVESASTTTTRWVGITSKPGAPLLGTFQDLESVIQYVKANKA